MADQRADQPRVCATAWMSRVAGSVEFRRLLRGGITVPTSAAVSRRGVWAAW
jgi:hypothetical protein